MTAAAMEVVESGLVVPSEETPKHSLWLSNLDLLVARAHTPTVYFYPRPSSGSQDFFSPEVLKASLGRALVPFYPLAGRLAVGSDGRVEISCTGEGVLFVVARSEGAVDDFGDFSPSTEMRDLLVPSVESGNPPCILVMFQVTFFKCGGVCLGAAIHHAAADGISALHFVNTWANIAAGATTTPPFLNRALLRARSPPTVLSDHPEYSQKAPPPPSNPSVGNDPSFDSAILKLSKDQLAILKHNNGNKPPLSTFKAVVAHVWRSACKSRKLKSSEATRLYMTADARTRVQPPLPPGYLGNAIFRASAVATAGEVMSSPLDFGAEKIHAATRKLDDQHVRSLIDFLELQEDVRGLAKGKWKMPETDLWIISWQGLPIYDADFGWGRPLLMMRACLQFSGLVYIMNNPGDDGGVSLAVALEKENMQEFKEIFYQDLGFISGQKL